MQRLGPYFFFSAARRDLACWFSGENARRGDGWCNDARARVGWLRMRAPRRLAIVLAWAIAATAVIWRTRLICHEWSSFCGDPDLPCSDPSCPQWRLQVYEAKLRELGANPADVLDGAIR